MITDFEQRIKGYWKGTPAVVIVKEIKRRSELPKWEDCPKDHIYVGVSRRKKGDKITVVRHQIEMICTCNDIKVEQLTEKDMYFTGAIPAYKDMVRSKCGEFSTRIDIGHICRDCADKEKVSKEMSQ
jgi:hypothetical protein